VKPSEILIAARALIDTPDKWTTGRLSRTKDGKATDYWSEDATCFCVLGAIFRANRRTYEGFRMPEDRCAAEMEAERAIQRATQGDVPLWNDDPGRTHAEVLEAYDRAIAALVEEGR
jgi:hypothetical protein